MEPIRKKSPRAPSITLQEAMERVNAAYEKERLHPAPTDVFAQNIGYKSANSGAALAAIASLRYYGLIERPRDGMLAVSREIEHYKYSPDDDEKQALLTRFLRNPPVFAELLDMYQNALPSDGTMRFELIRRGFLPAPAEAVVTIFRKSVEYVGYFGAKNGRETPEVSQTSEESYASGADENAGSDEPQTVAKPGLTAQIPSVASVNVLPPGVSMAENDCIPVRLTGSRRAWIVVPSDLREADKVRLKAQIDLLLTVEEEAGDS